jgi:agmatinase
VLKDPMPTFLPEDSLRTPRFVGITTFMRLPYTKDLPGVDVAVLGIPFRAIVDYGDADVVPG